jgi:hypothetical protein
VSVEYLELRICRGLSRDQPSEEIVKTRYASGNTIMTVVPSRVFREGWLNKIEQEILPDPLPHAKTILKF